MRKILPLRWSWPPAKAISNLALTPLRSFSTSTVSVPRTAVAAVLAVSSLVNSGITLFKLWFTLSQKHQHERFANRRNDPLRQWKLSPIDEASIHKFDDYTAARNEMLLATDTAVAPWTVINSNEKKRARLACLATVLEALDYEHKDHAVIGELDHRVVRPASTLHIGS